MWSLTQNYCGGSTKLPPPHCPACLCSQAQPGLQPPNTFHRGRLLSAHMGRGRAAKPGTRGAWERSASKEPHGQQGPIRPPTWPSPSQFSSSQYCLLSYPLPKLFPVKAPQYTPSTPARGHPNPNRHQYIGKYTFVHIKYMHIIQPVCIHPHTQTHGYLQIDTHMQMCTHTHRHALFRHHIKTHPYRDTQTHTLYTLHRHMSYPPTFRQSHIQTHTHMLPWLKY